VRLHLLVAPIVVHKEPIPLSQSQSVFSYPHHSTRGLPLTLLVLTPLMVLIPTMGLPLAVSLHRHLRCRSRQKLVTYSHSGAFALGGYFGPSLQQLVSYPLFQQPKCVMKPLRINSSLTNRHHHHHHPMRPLPLPLLLPVLLLLLPVLLPPMLPLPLLLLLLPVLPLLLLLLPVLPLLLLLLPVLPMAVSSQHCCHLHRHRHRHRHRLHQQRKKLVTSSSHLGAFARSEGPSGRARCCPAPT